MESDPPMKARFGRSFIRLEKKGQNLFFNAPHLVIVSTSQSMDMNFINIGNMITYGRIAAQSFGLGTCYHGGTQIALKLEPKIRRIARASGTNACAFTLGYPTVKYRRIVPRTLKRVRKV